MVEFVPVGEVDNAKASELSLALNCSDRCARLLLLRGVDTPEAAHAFFSHSLTDMHDPFLLPGMAEGVARIREAMDNKERIAVYGDYDCDGVVATSVLLLALRERGANVEYHIPSRHHDGYGLNMQTIDRIANGGAKLIITVDCGITAVDETRYAKTLGLDIVITDHHQPQDELPDAAALIAPTLPGGAYPFRELCGAGVAAKLVQGLFGMHAIEPYLDLVALATVADIVPLLGENRTIVTLGLERMRKTPNKALHALCDVSSVRIAEVSSSHLGFALGPRINAAGRMGDASRCVELFLTEDAGLRVALSKELSEENAARQAREREFLELAFAKMRELDMAKRRSICIESKGFDHGVIGIVASRLTEMFCVPVLLFENQDGVLKGSGRSIPGVNLFEALKRFSDRFEKFGGHEQAAGITMLYENFERFSHDFDEFVCTNYDEALFVPTMRYDLELDVRNVSKELVRELERFEPYGLNNQPPVFKTLLPRAESAVTIGLGGTHLKFAVSTGRQKLDCLYFKRADMLKSVISAEASEALITVQINNFRGVQSCQAVVRSLRPRGVYSDAEGFASGMDTDFLDAFARQILYNELATKTARVRVYDKLEFKTEILRRLSVSRRGTILTASTQAGAFRALEFLNANGLHSKLDVYTGSEFNNPAAFNALWLAPQFKRGHNPLDQYSEVFSFDGLPICDELIVQKDAAALKAALGDFERWAYAREELGALYGGLKQWLKKPVSATGMATLCERFKEQTRSRRSPMELRVVMKIFIELGLLALSETGRGVELSFVETSEKLKLGDAPTFFKLTEYIEHINRLIGLMES